MILKMRTRSLDVRQPRVMGILNCTPDSFSDGGRYTGIDASLSRVEQMLEEGADLIDIGGESSRPGAAEIELAEELARVIPVVTAVIKRFDCIVSVDTTKPEVMRRAIDAGAEMINDINALRSPEAIAAARDGGVAVCLMHMQGKPRTMQRSPTYRDVVSEVCDFLTERIHAAVVSGIAREKLCIDPGFGFGKTLHHNLVLLSGLGRFTQFGLPVLVGFSRKAMLGEITARRKPEARLAAGIAATTLAVFSGAAIVRTHDVAPASDAIKVVQRVLQTERKRS